MCFPWELLKRFVDKWMMAFDTQKFDFEGTSQLSVEDSFNHLGFFDEAFRTKITDIIAKIYDGLGLVFKT